MLCGIHDTPLAKSKPVKRGPKIAPRDIASLPMKSQADARSA
jgi:hypothetical protein